MRTTMHRVAQGSPCKQTGGVERRKRRIGVVHDRRIERRHLRIPRARRSAMTEATAGVYISASISNGLFPIGSPVCKIFHSRNTEPQRGEVERESSPSVLLCRKNCFAHTTQF